MHILVVDDHRDIACSIIDYIEIEGHTADYADSGNLMIELVKHNVYDVIFLDVMMPGLSGYESCRLLREQAFCNTPVLFLTARDTLDDKLQGFISGADDYLVKPFAMEELMARAKALTSRGGRQDIGETKLLDIHINHTSHQVIRQNKTVQLNQTQYKILCLLAKHYPNVVNKNMIEHEIWGDDLPDSDVLRTQIYHLRGKIDKPFSSSIIKNIHSIGFKLELST
ncbi:MAG: response regulator transcription factor [Cellvibrionaceae bacterium]